MSASGRATARGVSRRLLGLPIRHLIQNSGFQAGLEGGARHAFAVPRRLLPRVVGRTEVALRLQIASPIELSVMLAASMLAMCSADAPCSCRQLAHAQLPARLLGSRVCWPGPSAAGYRLCPDNAGLTYDNICSIHVAHPVPYSSFPFPHLSPLCSAPGPFRLPRRKSRCHAGHPRSVAKSPFSTYTS